MSETSTKPKQYGILDLMWDVRDTTLPIRGSAKQTLSALILRCSGSTGRFTCFPSIRLLADDTGLDGKTVQAAVQSLEEAKLVSIIRDRKHGSKENAVNQYIINVDLIRSLKEKQQHLEITTNDLADQYLSELHLREGVEAVINDIDRRVYAAWKKLWAKLQDDARAAFAAGGLDNVRFPAYVEDEPIFRLTQYSHHLAGGGDPEFFLPVDIPRGHHIEGVRAQDRSWRLRIVRMHCYRHMSPAEIDADFLQAEEDHAKDVAEYNAEERLVEKIGVKAYSAWKRVEHWDEEYNESIAPGKSKDEVIALLQAERPYLYADLEQPSFGLPLGSIYREQALAGVHPPAWAFK